MLTAPSISVFNKEYLSVLLSTIDESVIATDKNFIIQYWNKGAERIFGKSAEEVIGKPSINVLKFIYEKSRDEVVKQLKQEGKWKGILHYKSKNGKLLTIEAVAKAARNNNGKVIGYVTVHRDITIQDHTKASLATFLSVISSLDDTFFIVDKKLNLVFSDEKDRNIKEYCGLSLVKGESILKSVEPASRKHLKTCLTDTFNGEKPSCEIKKEITPGKWIYHQFAFFPVKDKDGFITHACILVRDVTAQKQLDLIKEKLYRSRQLFETFMEKSPILSWITDGNGIIKYLNPAYLKMYNLNRNDIGKSISDIFPQHATDFKKNDLIVLEKMELLQTEEQLTTPDGKNHIYRVIKFPVKREEEILIGGWAIDITDEMILKKHLTDSLHQLQQSENDLKKALTKEHQLNDMKSRFVSMASHEFRTPLSTILSSSFLIEKYKEGDQQVNRIKHINRIKESVHHMNALLEDFLSLGRLEEGKTFVNFGMFSLTELIESAMEDLEPIKKQGQYIDYNHKGIENIYSDKKLLRNIVINLMSNALKFSEPHKGITIDSYIDQDHLVMTFKDTGIGISIEDQQHLFDSFYRAKNAQNIQGTGLGLHIVKRYVTLLNGSIMLESELNKGTNVTIRIPAKV